ncbi:MAG: hypothetical protein V7K21_10360 [Nostoc sp.]|uniref:hypothetical protein n=1 Tax=Nostoc sp. TaxID=1180 RepID=UPI002FF51F9D
MDFGLQFFTKGWFEESPTLLLSRAFDWICSKLNLAIPSNANASFDNANASFDNANVSADNANASFDNANVSADNANASFDIKNELLSSLLKGVF